MFRKILVPLDGTTRAERVLPYAAVLAAEFGAELMLLGVSADERRPPADAGALAAALDPAIPPTTALQGAARRLVARVPALADRAADTLPYRVSARSAGGRLPQAILAVAVAERADLILMIGPETNGIAALRQGRIIAGLMHDAPVPLLLIPANAAAVRARSLAAAFGAVSPALLRHPLLVPLDGSPFAEKALGMAKMLAAKVCGALLLVEALPTPQDYLQPLGLVGSAIYLDFLDREQPDARAENYLRGCSEHGDLPIRNVERRVVLGRPAEAIVGCAGRCNPGLIAMASHARNGVSRFVLGSVTEQVLRLGVHPILVTGPAMVGGHMQLAPAALAMLLARPGYSANGVEELR